MLALVTVDFFWICGFVILSKQTWWRVYEQVIMHVNKTLSRWMQVVHIIQYEQYSAWNNKNFFLQQVWFALPWKETGKMRLKMVQNENNIN